MNYKQYKKNLEIVNGVEKAIKAVAGKQPVHFEIKDKHGKLTEVSKEEFAWWMVNEKGKDGWVGGVSSSSSVNTKSPEGKLVEPNKDRLVSEKDVKVPLKESLVYEVKGNIDGKEHFVERTDKDRTIKETYHEPRNEEEKNQVIKQDKEREEKEKPQTKKLEKEEREKNSAHSDKGQQSISSESKKIPLSTKIAIGGGVILVSGVLVGIVWKRMSSVKAKKGEI